MRLKLNELNLEGNNVGDDLVLKLCEWMNNFKRLNLTKNLITNKGALAISEAILVNYVTIALYLGWNNIKYKGAAAICDALNENDKLQIIDLSFNPIGIGKKKGQKNYDMTHQK